MNRSPSHKPNGSSKGIHMNACKMASHGNAMKTARNAASAHMPTGTAPAMIVPHPALAGRQYRPPCSLSMVERLTRMIASPVDSKTSRSATSRSNHARRLSLTRSWYSRWRRFWRRLRVGSRSRILNAGDHSSFLDAFYDGWRKDGAEDEHTRHDGER